MKATNKFGQGFDSEEFASPVTQGPLKNQEGFEPANPEFGMPKDPLGYLKESKE